MVLAVVVQKPYSAEASSAGNANRYSRTMKTLEMAGATSRLQSYARQASHEPLILTEDGKPIAALLPIENADVETVTLSMNPQFIALIERSRVRQESQGGISSQEMRRRLGANRTRRRRK